MSAEEITEHVKSAIASYKAPRHVVFVERIERSPSGKADYRWAKATAADALGVPLVRAALPQHTLHSTPGPASH